MRRVTVELSWGQSTAADLAGYKVYWSEGGNEPKALAFSGATLDVQLSVLLKPKTVYTFSVSAYDIAGNESARRVLKAVWCE